MASWGDASQFHRPGVGVSSVTVERRVTVSSVRATPFHPEKWRFCTRPAENARPLAGWGRLRRHLFIGRPAATERRAVPTCCAGEWGARVHLPRRNARVFKPSPLPRGQASGTGANRPRGGVALRYGEGTSKR